MEEREYEGEQRMRSSGSRLCGKGKRRGREGGKDFQIQRSSRSHHSPNMSQWIHYMMVNVSFKS